MSKPEYGALRARVVASAEERSDRASPHYQVLVMADGEPWRIAVNVKSSDKGGSGPDRSILLYRIIDDFRHPILPMVKSFKEGFNVIAPGLKNGGLDYIRGHLFDPKDLRLLPPDVPGDGNDLNDLIDAQVQRARRDSKAVLFAFGQPWGPENKPDQTFKFKPNRGVHDIHMNQGNPRSGGHASDNGIWHDGGLLFWFPAADRWVAVFLAFQSQSWHTDDRTGYPIPGKTGAEAALFDRKHHRLPPSEQIQPALDIAAFRVTRKPLASPAVLLLNTAEEDIELAGWSLTASPTSSRRLRGEVRASEALSMDLPDNFFDPDGGVATLADPSGLKVASATYPRVLEVRSGWHKVA